MALPTTKTEALYQKDGTLYTHTAPMTSIVPLSSLPDTARALFKPPEGSQKEPFILTTPSTIFHAQGGGQPSDTGTFSTGPDNPVFTVHQVRTLDSTILHMGILTHIPPPTDTLLTQNIDVARRTLNSRLHTAGHILGLAAAQLRAKGEIDSSVVDGKASHYPGASFVEFSGLIPGTVKAALQAATDELVARDLGVSVEFWSEARARGECTGVPERIKQDDAGVRVVAIGDVGSYPCGGTHVQSTAGCGRIVVRNIKRQKGVTKVSYEVQDV